MSDRRIRVITGHYGSGKSEFAVNYAVSLAKQGKQVCLVDLDVVNPYFRSREKEEELRELGIEVIASSIGGAAIDVPAVSGSILKPLHQKELDAVIDLGGDPVGARVLSRFYKDLQDEEIDVFFVVNAYRPETADLEGALSYLRRIEATARQTVTGLINNTHLLKSTKVEDVLLGQELTQALSRETQIPIRFVSCLETVAAELPDDIEGEVFPLQLYLREQWML
jgi:hypothetical protein